MSNKKKCVIPGAFDPVTVGHVDIIIRASVLFDEVYVAAFDNTAKKSKTMFNSSARYEMLRLACEGIENVAVDVTDKLVADYAREKNAAVIIKGVRSAIDFEYEREMFLINKKIGGDIDTLFFPARAEHVFISSTFVREMILYKKDISGYVPDKVRDYINKINKI